MRLWYALIALMLAHSSPMVLHADERPTVRRVRIEGARRVPEGRVRSWLLTRPGVPLDSLLLRQDVRRILDRYRDAGHWQVAVARPEVRVSGGRASVAFRIEEGRPTRIGAIEVTGNHRVPLSDLQEEMTARRGAPLIRRHLEADLEALLRAYENRGYPYCALHPEVELQPGKNLARLRIEIEEGPFVRVDTIRFTGNRTTAPEVLVREMRLVGGEAYDQRRVDRALQALRRLPFLLEVQGAHLAPEGAEGRTALVVAVRETPAARIEGGLGYAPGPEGPAHELTGALTLDFENILGTGRGAHASWTRQGPEASDLVLSYLEPWVLRHPLSAELHLEMRQRAGYAENRLGADLAFAPAPDVSLRIGIRREGVRPDSSARGPFVSSRAWALEGGFGYDTRDDRWNPRSGLLYRGTLSWGWVRRGDGGQRRRRYSLDLDHYLPLGRRSLAAVGIHNAGVVEGDRVPPEARLLLGGTATLRGHREEAFSAVRATWANLEWRVPLGRRSRAFLFLDLGYLEDAATDGEVRHLFPLGYGAGLRIESRLGLVGLDYGLAKGEGPGQGKVHVQMANEF